MAASATALERHWQIGLALLLMLFVARVAVASGLRALWFDELFTRNLATQPTWAMVRMGTAADGNPPLRR